MQIPPFDNFVKNFSFEKLSYDLNFSASKILKESSSLFTEEQYQVIASTIVVPMAQGLSTQHPKRRQCGGVAQDVAGACQVHIVVP